LVVGRWLRDAGFSAAVAVTRIPEPWAARSGFLLRRCATRRNDKFEWIVAARHAGMTTLRESPLRDLSKGQHRLDASWNQPPSFQSDYEFLRISFLAGKNKSPLLPKAGRNGAPIAFCVSSWRGMENAPCFLTSGRVSRRGRRGLHGRVHGHRPHHRRSRLRARHRNRRHHHAQFLGEPR